MPSPHRDRTANDIEKHRCVTRHVMRKYNNVARLRHFCGGGGGRKITRPFFLGKFFGGFFFDPPFTFVERSFSFFFKKGENIQKNEERSFYDQLERLGDVC